MGFRLTKTPICVIVICSIVRNLSTTTAAEQGDIMNHLDVHMKVRVLNEHGQFEDSEVLVKLNIECVFHENGDVILRCADHQLRPVCPSTGEGHLVICEIEEVNIKKV